MKGSDSMKSLKALSQKNRPPKLDGREPFGWKIEIKIELLTGHDLDWVTNFVTLRGKSA